MHHLMIETKSKAPVDEAYESAKRLGLIILMNIGQHSDDEMYSFYMMVAAGFAIEVGFDGKIIEDPSSWRPGFFDKPSLWGHELQFSPQ